MNLWNFKPKQLQATNVVTYVAVLLFNILSNALPLNGRTAGEISDELPSYFTPAGYTFSIWSLIYLGLFGFTVYQALSFQRRRPLLGRIGLLFAANGAANIVWLIVWHYGFYVLSIIFMVIILATLIRIYQRLNIGRLDPESTMADKLLVHVPFSLYLGWISVATIANIASVTAYLGWDGFGIPGPTWSSIMMTVAVILSGILLLDRRNLAYAAVLVWALIGIRSAYADVTLIANSALVASILIIALAIIGYWRTQQGGTPSSGRVEAA